MENSETKTLNDICDTPVITTDTINQGGDVANDAANDVANRSFSCSREQWYKNIQWHMQQTSYYNWYHKSRWWCSVM